MSFKQYRAIPTLNGRPLDLVDQFRYFDNNVSATESVVNIRLGKV